MNRPAPAGSNALIRTQVVRGSPNCQMHPEQHLATFCLGPNFILAGIQSADSPEREEGTSNPLLCFLAGAGLGRAAIDAGESGWEAWEPRPELHAHSRMVLRLVGTDQ